MEKKYNYYGQKKQSNEVKILYTYNIYTISNI